MRNARLTLALSILVCSSLAACVGPTDNPLIPEGDAAFLLDEDGGFTGFDASALPDSTFPQRDARPEQDSGVVDSTLADSGVPDANVPDSRASDANVADSNLPDTSVTDANVTDSNVADTNVADTNVADSNLADTDVPDTNVPDANDAAVSCVVGVFGDHYTTTDGKLFFATLNQVVVDNLGQPLLGITEVAQQLDHACGVRGSDGTVWCWPLSGSAGNGNGDLGNGTVGGAQPGEQASQVVTNAADAGAPVYLTGAVHISMNSMTLYTYPTCVIRNDHTVWCWGNSGAETTGPDGLFWGTTGSTASVPYAIPMNGGPADAGVVPMTADQVALGYRHACLRKAGQVACWGQNISGNLADGDPLLAFQAYPRAVVTGDGGTLPPIDEIGCGLDLTCAKGGGNVWCWGTTSADQMGNPSYSPPICGANYCAPIPIPVQQALPDGGSGQVPDAGIDQNPLTGATTLVVGYQFGCVLDAAGNIWCWGADATGNRPEATLYAPTFITYADATQLTAFGESVAASLRYTTASGVYVQGNSVVTPNCH